jgi:hypothetical protein
VAGFPGVAAVHVDDGNLFIFNGLLQVSDGDIGKLTRENAGGEEEAEEEGEQFFHGMEEFGYYGLR